MFEIIPPGIWLLKISVSTPTMFDANSAYLGRMPAKYSLILTRRSMSSSVWKPVPGSISTRLSVGLWPGPRLIEEIAASTQSAPASMPFISETSVTPVVAWQWMWIRTSWPRSSLIALTMSYAGCGCSSAAMSLRHSESQPRSMRSRAIWT